MTKQLKNYDRAKDIEISKMKLKIEWEKLRHEHVMKELEVMKKNKINCYHRCGVPEKK